MYSELKKAWRNATGDAKELMSVMITRGDMSRDLDEIDSISLTSTWTENTKSWQKHSKN